MRVFLSNTPIFILARELRENPVKRWIYLGTNDSVLQKLEGFFGVGAQQLHYGEKLYRIAVAKRNGFILWIDQVAASLLDKKEWLFSVSAVKNTYTSNLFLYICYLSLLEELIGGGERVDCIFVDSPALAALFRDRFPSLISGAPVNGWLKREFYLRSFTKTILRCAKYFLEFTRKFVFARAILKDHGGRLLQGRNNIVLIRNFITAQFSDTPEDILENHYFPGLYDYLAKKNYMPVFLPIVVQASSYRRLYRRVLESKKSIVFPEEFLKPQDYVYTFLMPLRALSLKLSPPLYGRYQLKHLLREEYYANLTESGFLYATLLSRLGKRFKERNLAPLGIINWMENQALEKGLIKGFRENFPQMQVIGSQPYFFPDNYFSTISAIQEKQAGLLPGKILVLGPVEKKWAIEFIKDIPVEYSPAFRYTSLVSEKIVNGEGNDLLVLLSIHRENALNMMRTLLKIEPYLRSFRRVMIKLHPAGIAKKDFIKIWGQNLPEYFQFVDGKLEEYLDRTSVGLCGASGTVVELVMKGIPVVMIGDPHALTMGYLSCKEDPDMWRICFSTQQVIEALAHLRAIKKNNGQALAQKALEFRELFIAPPSEKYWENYLVETSNV